MKDEQDACEEFMFKFFNEILKPLFERQMLPMVGEIVENEVERVEIKGKFTCDDIVSIFDKIHQKIMTQFFSNDTKTAPDSTDLNLSFDSTESGYYRPLKSSWLLERLLDQYKLVSD